jgi:COMPASS component SWD1
MYVASFALVLRAFISQFLNNSSFEPRTGLITAWGRSCCIKFNRKGDYLASGTLDGTVVIFDFDTYGPLAILRGHTRPIQSLR